MKLSGRRHDNATAFDMSAKASAPDAARLGARRQGLPQQPVFRRRRQQRFALAAEAAVEFGLREQRADLRLAAGRQQSQPVERAGQSAARYQTSRLTEPARQPEVWIVIGADEAEALACHAVGGLETDEAERAELAGQRLAVRRHRDRTEC